MAFERDQVSERGRSRGLPMALSPLIGRETMLASLRAVLLSDDIRLVTLLGPGGSGKTRLALSLAEEVIERDRLDALFVDLTSIRAADNVPLAIAQAAGIPDRVESSIAEIAEELSNSVDL